jgi:alpha-galactosidase
VILNAFTILKSSDFKNAILKITLIETQSQTYPSSRAAHVPFSTTKLPKMSPNPTRSLNLVQSGMVKEPDCIFGTSRTTYIINRPI